ncbi:MAG: PAS domain S-box protein [Desulfococcaceae bacterium]
MTEKPSYEALEKRVRELEHARDVLRALRNVNRLVVLEKDPGRLLDQACRCLRENRGYFNVWMTRMVDGRPVEPFHHSGFDRDFARISDRIRKGEIPDCARGVLETAGPVVVRNPRQQCGDCPLVQTMEGRAAMAMRLEHGGRVFGWMTVSVPTEFVENPEERNLFAEVAADLGFALWSIESDRRREEEALAAGENKYRALYDNAPLAYQSLDPDGRLLDVNPQWLKTLGYDRETVIGQSFADFLHPDWRPHFEKNFPAFKKRGHVHDVQFRLRHAAGHFIDVSFEGCIGYRPDGSVQQTYCVFKDITDQLRAEAELRETSAFLRAALDCSPAGISIADVPDGRLRYVNEAGLGIGGGRREELVGLVGLDAFMETWEIFHLDGTPFAPEDIPLVRAVRQGERCTAPMIIRRPDAEDRIVHAHAAPVFSEAGEQIAGIVVFPDITEQKRNEASLLRSEQKFRDIFDAVSDAVYVHDLEGRFLEVNAAALRQLGHSREELLDMGVAQVEANDLDEDAVREATQAVRQNGNRVFTSEHRRKDGETFPVEVHSRTIDHEGNPCILSVVRDISERRLYEIERSKMETELRLRNQFIETILDNLPIGLAANYIDEGSATYMNRKFEEIYGWPRSVIRDISSFFENVFPEPAYRKEIKNKVMTDIDSGDPERMAWEGIEITDQQGRKKIIAAKNIPLYDQNLMISTVQDITEERKLQAQLRQAQKMEAVGALAGGIAHDFNNILSPVLGLSEMLMEDLPRGALAWKNVREIFRAGERGRDLVKQILAFSRHAEQENLPLRISPIVKEAIQLCRSTIPANIEIRRHIAADPGLVLADPTQIHQIVMNLVTNAYHAVEADGGEIMVRLGPYPRPAEDPAEEGLPPGRYVRLSVADTGPGIPPEVREKVFEPYFTTKEQGKGTGLGLAVVYGIVRKHGGEIRLSGGRDRGAEVVIYLPLIPDSGSVEEVADTDAPEPGTERILLVDDEPSIVRMQRKMLERLGYQVAVAASSPAALTIFRETPDAFDLVVSDLSMPKMTGLQLAGKIYAIRPETPVILCTGYRRNIPENPAERFGIRGVLNKPIRRADLAKMVRSVLDGERE